MGLPKIVGEIGINHSGSVDLANEIADIFLSAADSTGYPRNKVYIKFQKRDVETSVPQHMRNISRVGPSGNQGSYIDYKRDVEFSLEEYIDLDWINDACAGLFMSAWDTLSVDFICEYFPDVPYIKVPSAHLTNDVLINRCVNSGIPLVLSTGMSTQEEVIAAVNLVPLDYPLTILACVSSYPTKDADLQLSRIKTLKYLFDTRAIIGYSGHSPSPFPHCYAMLLGAEMVEAHICRSRSDYGSDSAASLERKGMELIFREAQRIDVGMGDGYLRILGSELSKRESLKTT